MIRKTAAAAVKVDQPDLLGGAPPAAKPAPKSRIRGETARQIIQDDPHKPEVAKPAVNKGNLTVVKNTPHNTLALLTDAFKDPSFKPENLKIVAELHEKMIAEQARIDFINAFFLMKQEMPRINKDGKIEILEKGQDGKRVAGRDKVQQATPYATYENIREVIDPILNRFGFSMWDETEPSADGARINVITHLDHNNGHGRRSIFPLPAEVSGSKNNVQGWGSSNSYGKRYGAINLCNIRTKAPEDRDLDGNKPKVTKSGKPQVVEGKVLVDQPGDDEQVEVCSEQQLLNVRDAIAACGVSDGGFCKHFGIQKVSQLPADRYEDAIAACRNHKK